MFFKLISLSKILSLTHEFINLQNLPSALYSLEIVNFSNQVLSDQRSLTLIASTFLYNFKLNVTNGFFPSFWTR